MATDSTHPPRHRMASLLDPRSLLVVSDRTLPVMQQPPSALRNACTVVSVTQNQPIIVPDTLPFEHSGGQPDLAVICVSPHRLAEVLDAVQPHQPQAVLILRHDVASPHPVEDVAFCRRWGALNDCLVLGPGSFGLQRPHLGLNLSLDPYRAPAGRVALVAQSATIMAAVLDWSEDISLGFSALVSIEDESIVEVSDVLDYLSMDARTHSIVLYLERPSSSRHFTSALRSATSVKPVVVLKPGRHPMRPDPALQRIAASEHAVFDALLRRTGAVRVRYFIQLFSALKVLIHSRRVQGRRIALLSNGRAAARLALDVMGPDAALRPAELSQSTVKALAELLEPEADARNPVVTIRPLQAPRIEQMVRVLQEDSGVDGVLVLLAPDPYTDLEEVADQLASMADTMHKPVISCFMGDAGMRGLRQRLDRVGTPAFRTPESAVEGFGLLTSYYDSQKAAQQTLPSEPLSQPPRLEHAHDLLRNVQRTRRRELTHDESRDLLEYFYIPIDIVPDLDVSGEPAAADVPPMVIRVERDARFGPYIAFGAGRHVEWVVDSSRTVDLPPLNRYLARQLVQRNVLWRRVLSRKLSPAALELLYESLERISELISELPAVDTLIIDPLVGGDRLLQAGQVQITLRVETMLVLPETTGYRHLAIHPYPRRLVQEMRFNNGDTWLLRPIRPEDAEPLQDFVRNLSEKSRYMRFVSMLRELTPRMLARYTSIDYDRELALVATILTPNPKHRGYPEESIIGFAHYLRNADGRGAEYALAISDDWQRCGLGSQLMRTLIDAAQIQGLAYIDGYVLANNRPMLSLMASLGFRNDPDTEDPGMRRVWLDLSPASRLG